VIRTSWCPSPLKSATASCEGPVSAVQRYLCDGLGWAPPRQRAIRGRDRWQEHGKRRPAHTRPTAAAPTTACRGLVANPSHNPLTGTADKSCGQTERPTRGQAISTRNHKAAVRRSPPRPTQRCSCYARVAHSTARTRSHSCSRRPPLCDRHGDDSIALSAAAERLLATDGIVGPVTTGTDRNGDQGGAQDGAVAELDLDDWSVAVALARPSTGLSGKSKWPA